MGPVTEGNLPLNNLEGRRRGLGAADAAEPPGVRKRGHDGYGRSPSEEVWRERGGGSCVGTLRSLFVTLSLKRIQGGGDFFREE